MSALQRPRYMARRARRDFHAWRAAIGPELAVPGRRVVDVPDSANWDVQRLRAAELDAAGLTAMAKSVDACGHFTGRRCGARLCPRCAPQYLHRLSGRVTAAVGTMRSPRLVIVTYPSSTLDDLDKAVDGLRSGLDALKRRKAIRASLSGGWVGTLEPKLADCGRFWSLHVHLFVDFDTAHLPQLADRWRVRTGNRGSLKLHDSPVVKAETIHHAVRYAVKSRDWSPKPGALTLRAFRGLMAGMYRRQFAIRWRVPWGAYTGTQAARQALTAGHGLETTVGPGSVA